ncbi:dephospho-CoA kinase [Mariluticola halotolerans]|nr:dephospho-CoA kinase [Mariluticola halotolerans]UJQ93540.1 dephospho-CoA kinase [Mariluticola halotolerans]
MMFALGLTGSIATGKSTVLALFKDQGIPVYSADDAVHALYQGEAVTPVEALFPGVAENGVINRQKLAGALIAAPDRIGELEAVVHPLVHQKMQQFLDDTAADGADLAVLEIPLLFETGKDYPVDAVAVTACSDAEQRRRALARPGMSVEKLETILARQMPQAEKKRRAGFVINTDVPLPDTRAEVIEIIEKCRGTASSKD